MAERYLDFSRQVPDPYDLWACRPGLWVRRKFYDGALLGKIGAVGLAVVDWLVPATARRLFGCHGRVYPITVAQMILMNPDVDAGRALKGLRACAVPDRDRYGLAWGLGFPWMSKNGLYPPEMPFVTHTPYAMEALIRLQEAGGEIGAAAHQDFLATWQFLESLHVMADSADELALSYAPVSEPRIVINANAYACFAYALHGVYQPDVADYAFGRARRLARFVVGQQAQDGAWQYYADSEPGNFIDCFHSCFVIKNLGKAAALDHEIGAILGDTLIHARQYINRNFYDERVGLVRRFTERDIKDPYVWDLYDQAEYLGVLIDAGDLERAADLADSAVDRFYRSGHWYCRTDFFGRRWGRDFARWGIVPFLYQYERLRRVTGQL